MVEGGRYRRLRTGLHTCCALTTNTIITYRSPLQMKPRARARPGGKAKGQADRGYFELPTTLFLAQLPLKKCKLVRLSLRLRRTTTSRPFPLTGSINVAGNIVLHKCVDTRRGAGCCTKSSKLQSPNMRLRASSSLDFWAPAA